MKNFAYQPEESVLDRRREMRRELSFPCRIIWRNQSFEGRVLDLSLDGAFVQTDTVPLEGADVEIVIVEEGAEVVIGASVLHTGTYRAGPQNLQGFGVKFSNPPAQVIERLIQTHQWRVPSPKKRIYPTRVHLDVGRALRRMLDTNKELWLVFSLIVISAVLNFLVSSNQMVLGFYSLPTLFSAYFYGRRHATLTALASVLLVFFVTQLPVVPSPFHTMSSPFGLQLVVWGGTLIVTAYAMGTLYERMQYRARELRQTYNGILLILQHFISNDQYTQHHSYRVSVYATTIASEMGLDGDRVEDIRTAALLHDIGKLKISRDILYKAARLTEEEYEHLREHVDRGVSILEPFRGSLRRILPMVLAHHDNFDGTGYHSLKGEDIPLGARIIAVADVYDATTSDRPYRKAMSPFEAKEIILKGMGRDFDPQVVKAFLSAFRTGGLEVPPALA
ncbi:MAG: HD domain-containing phosphohydrolase [Acidobacteriota bacterium]